MKSFSPAETLDQHLDIIGLLFIALLFVFQISSCFIWHIVELHVSLPDLIPQLGIRASVLRVV